MHNPFLPRPSEFWPPVVAVLVLICLAPAAQAQDRHAAPHERTLERPLFLTEGRLIVPVDITGAGEQFFILDTAASSSVISSRLRTRLAIDSAEVRRDTVQGAGGRRVMEKVLLPGIAVGGETFTDVDPVVLDFSDFRDYGGRPVEGILGTDVLQHYDVEIDVAAGTMRLRPRGSGASDDEAPGIPFESRSASGFVEFELLLNGQPVRGVLDTGASRSVLNWPAAEAVGVSRDDPDLRKSPRGSGGITGGRTATHFCTFDDLEVGPARLRGAEVKVADLAVFEALGIADGPAMLVGLDVLEACTVTIAYSTSRLRICE